LIFNALRINKSITDLKFSEFAQITLNLKNPESLQFIEENSTIRVLNLSYFQFSEMEMEILGESLTKNRSVTDLDLSNSNYSSSFNFLKKNFLKKFSFAKIWGLEIDFKNFFENLKFNESLTKLNLSFGYGLSEDDNSLVHKFIDFMAEFNGNVEELIFNILPQNNYQLEKLLKNQKIRKLDLMGSHLDNSETILNLFKELNKNDTLIYLDISNTDLREANWDELQFENSTIESLNFMGNSNKRSKSKDVELIFQII
jgi:hypothetical protein